MKFGWKPTGCLLTTLLSSIFNLLVLLDLDLTKNDETLILELANIFTFKLNDDTNPPRKTDTRKETERESEKKPKPKDRNGAKIRGSPS